MCALANKSIVEFDLGKPLAAAVTYLCEVSVPITRFTMTRLSSANPKTRTTELVCEGRSQTTKLFFYIRIEHGLPSKVSVKEVKPTIGFKLTALPQLIAEDSLLLIAEQSKSD